ncbi:MAG: Gfo/Idh/MocA family protein [Gemmatimonadota bacterium]
MAERVLRVGIIGLGNVAVHHLEAYRPLSSIDVVSGAELRADRLEEMADTYGFTPHTDYREMLQTEQLDIACVLTPVNTHREFVEAAADHGVHVLCEKPLALALEDAEAMVASCHAAGVKLFYGAVYRFLPALVRAREMIRRGDIGEVRLLTEFLLGGRGPAHQHQMGVAHYPEGSPGGSGMGLVDHGIHLVDAFAWLLDSEIVSVSGRGNRSGASPSPELMTMRFANGATGQLVYDDGTFSCDMPGEGTFSAGAGWNVAGDLRAAGTWHDQPGNIRIYGTEGSLRLFHYANKLFVTTASGQKQVMLPHAPSPAHFGAQMESCARSVTEDTEPETPGEAGVRALRTLLELYDGDESS